MIGFIRDRHILFCSFFVDDSQENFVAVSILRFARDTISRGYRVIWNVLLLFDDLCFGFLTAALIAEVNLWLAGVFDLGVPRTALMF